MIDSWHIYEQTVVLFWFGSGCPYRFWKAALWGFHLKIVNKTANRLTDSSETHQRAHTSGQLEVYQKKLILTELI